MTASIQLDLESAAIVKLRRLGYLDASTRNPQSIATAVQAALCDALALSPAADVRVPRD